MTGQLLMLEGLEEVGMEARGRCLTELLLDEKDLLLAQWIGGAE